MISQVSSLLMTVLILKRTIVQRSNEKQTAHHFQIMWSRPHSSMSEIVQRRWAHPVFYGNIEDVRWMQTIRAKMESCRVDFSKSWVEWSCREGRSALPLSRGECQGGSYHCQRTTACICICICSVLHLYCIVLYFISSHGACQEESYHVADCF